MTSIKTKDRPQVVANFMADRSLTNVALAKIGGVTERTVRNWLNGTQNVTQPMMLLIEAVNEKKLPLDWLKAKTGSAEQKPTRTMKKKRAAPAKKKPAPVSAKKKPAKSKRKPKSVVQAPTEVAIPA
jgi:plasmid maintenance system antidote protein VapI